MTTKTRAKEIQEIGDRLFSKRLTLMSWWQDMADNFYPERADFTTERTIGDEFGGNLMNSYPVLARRTLADQFGAMLRPRQKPWNEVSVSDEARAKDPTAKRWLEQATIVQRNFMYERDANFVRVTSEGDHDFATFGNAVLDVRMRRNQSGLLYRSHHIRDVVWCEDAEGKIDHVDRKVKYTAKSLVEEFGQDKVSDDVRKAYDKEPYREFDCRHIVMKSRVYGGKLESGKKYNDERRPFMELYILCDGDGHILSETPKPRLGFIIPRWKTLSGSQYGFSPATSVCIHDARLMQQMTLTLLEAGEKAVTPPMIAVQEAIRSDIDLFAGGVTHVDAAYDERLGEVLRPITQQLDGIRYGVEMLRDVRQAIMENFYLNKINLPAIGADMTAFETQERVKEYIRSVLPLFEPMETEYNGALCEETFSLLFERGAFGRHQDIPRALANQEIRFVFQSPLQATAERAKLEAFNEVAMLTKGAMELDPSVIDEVNFSKAFRGAVDGTQAPTEWLNDPEYVEQLRAHRAEQAKVEKMAAVAERAAGIADQAGSAMAGFSKAAA